MTDLASINRDAFPDPGDVPALDWVDKTLITADPLYQRPLDQARVANIAKAFTWRSFGALVVVPQKNGTYHVSDGQHRVGAAQLHPRITHVPAVIVAADDIETEAAIFVDINRNRKNVSPLELFFAGLASGDEDAETIRQVTDRAGVRIPKSPGNPKPGDTIAVSAIQALVGRRGAMRAREYLQALKAGRFAPIKGEHLKALEHVMHDEEFAGHVALEDLTALIEATGDTLNLEAKRFAATHGVPFWKGLATIWFQKSKKRRAPAKEAA